VRSHPQSPSIPADVLARKASLKAALQAMEAAGPSLEAPCLLDLRTALSGSISLDFEALLRAIEAGGMVEEAFEVIRTLHRELPKQPAVEALALRLGALALKAQQRRTARWQLDTRRTLIRITYEKASGVLDFDDGDLHALFLHACRLEGLQLALDLGKRPRPLLSASLPLPVGVGGLAESMDAVLKQEPMDEPAPLMARLNRRLPEGLRVHQWDPLPGYASPLAELALRSRWRWAVPATLRRQIERGITTFLATEARPWDRGGAKADAPLDLKAIVTDLRWEGEDLHFATAMGALHAINPLKLLDAMLDPGSPTLAGLVRTGVDLKPDLRLLQGDRFVPKLKNMYEDAVMLEGGSNITLVEEDDDEPLRLG